MFLLNNYEKKKNPAPQSASLRPAYYVSKLHDSHTEINSETEYTHTLFLLAIS